MKTTQLTEIAVGQEIQLKSTDTNRKISEEEERKLPSEARLEPGERICGGSLNSAHCRGDTVRAAPASGARPGLGPLRGRGAGLGSREEASGSRWHQEAGGRHHGRKPEFGI